MSEITVNAENLRGADRTLNDTITDLGELYNSINRMAGELRDTWDGAACEEYISRLIRHNEDLKAVIQLLEEFRNYAAGSAELFETLDQLFRKIPFLGGAIK